MFVGRGVVVGSMNVVIFVGKGFGIGNINGGCIIKGTLVEYCSDLSG